jgi:hypothetical protein
MGNKYFRNRDLTPAQQRYQMSVHYPEFKFRLEGRATKWRGTVQPTALSDIYLVDIAYRMKKRPRIIVLRPKLQAGRDGTRAPHTYGENEPCLYYPIAGDWHAGKSIATSIVPWISMWLFFYEYWQVTGTWLGGGIEHGSGEKR